MIEKLKFANLEQYEDILALQKKLDEIIEAVNKLESQMQPPIDVRIVVTDAMRPGEIMIFAPSKEYRVDGKIMPEKVTITRHSETRQKTGRSL